jgi:hypothetical protein
MGKRRSKGDGGLHWDEHRQRWIATASLGYRSDGKRIIKRASGRTKTRDLDVEQGTSARSHADCHATCKRLGS